MPDYRIYLTDADGRIQRGHDLPAAGDDEACAAAREMLAKFPQAEVWQGARKVASITREGPLPV